MYTEVPALVGFEMLNRRKLKDISISKKDHQGFIVPVDSHQSDEQCAVFFQSEDTKMRHSIC